MMRPGARITLCFSILSVLLFVLAALLETRHYPAYYALVQEDGPLEWATFWAFAGAAAVAVRRRLAAAESGGWQTLYLGGLALGCLVIAMEEISWGQRLFSYRPPDVFLTDNYQQELNLHNFAGTDVRKAALVSLLLGFGALLPLGARLPPARNWLLANGIHPPSLPIVPGFVIATAVYLAYPWQSTGEWVELAAGLGFLAAAVEYPGHRARGFGGAPAVARGLLAPVAALLLGAVTPWLIPPAGGAERLATARAEAEALAADFRSKRLRSRCGVHKRVFTFIEEYGSRRLDAGAFAKLPNAIPDVAERRTRYLDPWNLPYWIRHVCSSDRQVRTAFVYSFGPNRRRDSTAWAIGGDDVGHYVLRAGSERDR